ncbi:MAG TPA: DMT family transporter [Methylophilaceae bacterium]|jgi:drug/metabolite transporter (DMT)-like permease
MQTQKQHIYFGSIMVLVSAIAFSSKAIIVKLAYVYAVDAATLIALRMLFSIPFFVGLAIWARSKHTQDALSRKELVGIVLLATVGGYGSMWLNFAGLQYVTAGLERVILFLYPTMVVLMSAAVFKRAISRREVFALAASYAGVILVVWHDVSVPHDASVKTLLGALLVLASAIVYAAYLVCSGRIIPRLGASLFTAYTMLIATVASAAHFAISEDIQVAMHLPAQVYWLCLLMAVVATVLPSVLMNIGIQHLGSSKAALMSSIGPVSTIFLAYLFLGEKVTLVQLLGTALVLLGVLAISLGKRLEHKP